MQYSEEALVKTIAAKLNLEKYTVNVSKKEKKPIEKVERKSATRTICDGNRMPQ